VGDARGRHASGFAVAAKQPLGMSRERKSGLGRYASLFRITVDSARIALSGLLDAAATDVAEANIRRFGENDLRPIADGRFVRPRDSFQ